MGKYVIVAFYECKRVRNNLIFVFGYQNIWFFFLLYVVSILKHASENTQSKTRVFRNITRGKAGKLRVRHFCHKFVESSLLCICFGKIAADLQGRR